MLPIKFNINQVPSSHVIADIELSLQDDYRNLVYVGKPQPDQVPISYIGMPEPSVLDIDIYDSNESPRSLEIIENSYITRFRRRFTQKEFFLSVKDALITDVVNVDDSGTPIPLFYKHVISDSFAAEPEVLDQDLRPVPASSYKLLVTDNEIALCHNLDPTYNDINRNVTIYYIRYTNLAGESIFSLLESASVFKRANLIDGLNRWNRTYTTRRRGTNYKFNILFAGNGPFFLKATQEHQIKLNKPLFIQPNSPWNLRISDGEISAAYPVGGVERYSIPEYHLQQFSPIEPTQLINTAECLQLTDHIVKTPYNHLLDDVDHIIDVLVTDSSFIPKYGWTTGPVNPPRVWVDRLDRWRAQGDAFNFELAPKSRGFSVNKFHGFLHIPAVLEPTDRVFIRAHREVRDYTYLNLNLNPLHNRLMNTCRAIVYVIPESSVNEMQTSIYHILVDENDDIVSWNDPRLGDEELIAGLVPGEGETGLGLFKTEFPTNLIVGTVSVNRGIALSDLTFIDVREKGNTLTAQTLSRLPELLETYPELLWLADETLSGRSIPILGAFKVEAPFEILEEAGGDFTRETINNIVHRHMAVGSHPIIDYYADIPYILDLLFDATAKTLKVTWTGIDQADNYRIYLGDKPRAIYYSHEAVGAESSIFEGAFEETIQLAGADASADIDLTALDTIYVYIAPLKDGTEWPASRVGKIDITQTNNIVVLAFSAILTSPPTVSLIMNAIIE